MFLCHWRFPEREKGGQHPKGPPSVRGMNRMLLEPGEDGGGAPLVFGDEGDGSAGGGILGGLVADGLVGAFPGGIVHLVGRPFRGVEALDALLELTHAGYSARILAVLDGDGGFVAGNGDEAGYQR